METDKDIAEVFGTASQADAKADTDKVPCVLFGTAAANPIFEKYLLPENKDKREVYTFTVEENRIVIAGSDKRGVIYGLFHLSQMLDVSPLVDWCGILPPKKKFFDLIR